MNRIIEGLLGVLVLQASGDVVPADELLSSGLGCRLAYHIRPDKLNAFITQLGSIDNQALSASDLLELHNLMVELEVSASALVISKGVGADVVFFNNTRLMGELRCFCKAQVEAAASVSLRLGWLRDEQISQPTAA